MLFIIEANEQAGDLLINTLKNINATELLYADQLIQAIIPIKDQLTILETVFVDVVHNQTVAYFNKTFEIYEEGVYQTFFLYGQLKEEDHPVV